VQGCMPRAMLSAIWNIACASGLRQPMPPSYHRFPCDTSPPCGDSLHRRVGAADSSLGLDFHQQLRWGLSKGRIFDTILASARGP